VDEVVWRINPSTSFDKDIWSSVHNPNYFFEVRGLCRFKMPYGGHVFFMYPFRPVEDGKCVLRWYWRDVQTGAYYVEHDGEVTPLSGRTYVIREIRCESAPLKVLGEEEYKLGLLLAEDGE